jgi:hypothetical protein
MHGAGHGAGVSAMVSAHGHATVDTWIMDMVRMMLIALRVERASCLMSRDACITHPDHRDT